MQAGHARHLKAAALQRNVVPVDAAVVAQHVEQRVATHQVVAHQRVAPQFVWLAVFAQHVQAGGVVNLCIHQKHGADGGVAQGACRLQRGEAANLLEDVG